MMMIIVVINIIIILITIIISNIISSIIIVIVITMLHIKAVKFFVPYFVNLLLLYSLFVFYRKGFLRTQLINLYDALD